VFEMHEFPEYLSRRGHDVGFLDFPEGATNVAHQSPPLLNGERFRRLQADGYVRLFTPKIRFANRLLARLITSLRAFWILPSVLREFRPDVVVTYAVPTYGWQATILCRLLRVPIAYRAIDLSHRIRGGLVTPLVWLAEKFVIRFTNLTIANSPAMKDYCDRNGASLSTVAPPIVSSEHWTASPKQAERGQIVFLGTFFPFSGLERFVTYFAEHSLEDDKLVLAGSGPVFERIRNLIRELDVGDRISLPGWVSFEELGILFGQAKVAVNPMLKLPVTDYALPNKVLQYLWAGVPTVSTRLLGLESYFGKSPGCNLFFENSPEDVAQKALGLLRCDFEKSPNCRVLDQFSESSAVSQFERALESML